MRSRRWEATVTRAPEALAGLLNSATPTTPALAITEDSELRPAPFNPGTARDLHTGTGLPEFTGLSMGMAARVGRSSRRGRIRGLAASGPDVF